MHELKDAYGSPVTLGDTIIYAVKNSTSVGIRYAVITGIHWNGTQYKPYSLKIVAYTKRYDWQAHGYKPCVYRTTLTEVNFVKATIPEDVHKQLLEGIRF